MLRAGLVFVLLSAVAAPSLAQAPKSIDPGMSETKVVERLGAPDASRAAGDYKYLFYHNDCIRKCGMDDVVILRSDSVVDAMFRSADRAYTGKSSSPRSIPAEVAARTRPSPRELPSGEVVQAGAVKAEPPKADSAAKPAPKHTAAKAEPAAAADTAAKTAPTEKPVHKPAKKAAASTAHANADTARRDTIIGASLRIPVKPPIHSTAKPDSTRPQIKE
jgi:hypothetical protein